MKKAKRPLSLLMALVLLLSLAVPAFAAEEPETRTLVSWVGGTSPVNNGGNDILEGVRLIHHGRLQTSASGNLSAQNWKGTRNFADGEVFTDTVFAISSSGYKELTVSMVAGSNGNAPASYWVDYSTDGVTWITAEEKLAAPGVKANTVESAVSSSVKLPDGASNRKNLSIRIRQASPALSEYDAGALYIYSLAVTGTVTEPLPTPCELSSDIDGISFVKGQTQEFHFSTVANDDMGTLVTATSVFNDFDAVEKLEYYEPNGAAPGWYELKGMSFGPEGGFPLSDAESSFRVTFRSAGEFPVSVTLKAADGRVLGTLEATFRVQEEKPDEPTGEYAGKTVIIHTNDVHGAIAGYAKAAALKKDFEAKGANVLLVDAGDFCQGTPYVSTTKGAAAVEIMNAAGYDVVTLGNHDFGYGYTQLVENLENASFEVLCCNVFKDGMSIYPSLTLREFDGIKVGFFGVLTPSTQTQADPTQIKGLEFASGERLCALAQQNVDILRLMGADLVVCLSHLGTDDTAAPNRSVDLLAGVTGIDMVIDGHSHSVITATADLPVQSTGTAFANIGVVIVDNETHNVCDSYLVPVTDDMADEPETAAVAQVVLDRVDAEYGRVFARSEVDLNGDKAPGNRTMETNLGDLVTDAMRWKILQNKDGLTVDEDHVVAVTNGGGIRAWIRAGDITKKDVNTVLPFGNTLSVVYITGAELLEALEASTFSTPAAVGGFPQVSGISFTVAACAEYKPQAEPYPGSTYYGPESINRVTINSINGKAFDPEDVYAVVTHDFCAVGGDTYYAFAAASAQFDTGIPLDETLMEFITQELGGVVGREYAAPKGRIDITPERHIGGDWETVMPSCVKEGGNAVRRCAYCGCLLDSIDTEYTPGDHSSCFFTDIASSGFHDEIIYANKAGLASGYADGTFRPNANVTRAQFVTFLWRMAGEPEAAEGTLSFTDAGEIAAPFRSAVAWGVEQGIIAGYGDNSFRPNQNISRAQMATFIYRYLVNIAGWVVPAEAMASAGYKDEAEISVNYIDAVNAMAYLGIMKGVNTAPDFRADGVSTRGMAAAVILRTAKAEF